MKKNKLSTYLVVIAVVTFLAIFTLIVQNSYSKMIGPLKQPQVNNLIRPIDPNLEIDTLLQIENRQEYQSAASSATGSGQQP